MAPFHPLDGNPSLQLRRDIDLAVRADELGFDELWFGEHHSAGFETIGSPELMIAAAGERTRRIRLGTGVNSVSYPPPLILADRHPATGPSDGGPGDDWESARASCRPMHSCWVSTRRRQRDMMAEAIEALLPLLRGESVTMKTFLVRPARGPPAAPAVHRERHRGGHRLGVLPHRGHAGRTAWSSSVLSVAASDRRARGQLAANWAIHEQAAAEHGHAPRRDRWRVVGMMHLAEDVDQARREVEHGILRSAAYFEGAHRAEDAVGVLTRGSGRSRVTDGLPSWGVGVIGTPDDAIAAIERLQGGERRFRYLPAQRPRLRPEGRNPAQLRAVRGIRDPAFPAGEPASAPRASPGPTTTVSNSSVA